MYKNINTYPCVNIKDIPKDYNDEFLLSLGNSTKLITLAYQETKYGYKRFFKCPICCSRRTELFLDRYNNKIGCRKCLKLKYPRQYIYDENVENIIKFKARCLLKELEVDLYEKIPGGIDYKISMLNFALINYPKPKYMRWERYSYIRKALFLLDFTYWKSVNKDGKFTVKDINSSLDKTNVIMAWEHLKHCYKNYY